MATLNARTTSKNNGVFLFTCQSNEEIVSVGGVVGGGGGWAPQIGPPLPADMMNLAVPPSGGSVDVFDCPVKPDLLTVMVTDPSAIRSNTALPAMSVCVELAAPKADTTQTAAPEIGAVVVPTITLRFVNLNTGGFTVSVALLLTPPALAVIFTVLKEGTWLVVTANVWLLAPALTTMLGNTDATLVSSLDKLTVAPPDGALDEMVTVP